MAPKQIFQRDWLLELDFPDSHPWRATPLEALAKAVKRVWQPN